MIAPDREQFFARVRSQLFGGVMTGSQVAGVNAILATWDASAGSDPRFVAYSLATAFHETAKTMQPVEEIGRGEGRRYGRPTRVVRRMPTRPAEMKRTTLLPEAIRLIVTSGSGRYRTCHPEPPLRRIHALWARSPRVFSPRALERKGNYLYATSNSSMIRLSLAH
jgi:hypothetical protein